MSIVLYAFQNFRQSINPQNEVDLNLPNKTLFREEWIIRLRARQEEDKDKVIDCVANGDDANQLLVLFSVVNNLLETHYLAEQLICYQHKCLGKAQVINPVGPLGPRQPKLSVVVEAKCPEVVQSPHNTGQC